MLAEKLKSYYIVYSVKKYPYNNINKNVIMTNYDPTNPCRRSTRLKKYDYSQAGVYFITLVIKNRNYLFGDIKNGDMIVNDAGKNTERCWFEIPNHYQNTQLYEYIVMPNHFHGIIKIVGTENIPALGSIIRGFKIGVTKWFQKKSLKDYPIGKSIWQRNYWEHVIRNKTEYKHIAQYIIDNPMQWEKDQLKDSNKNIVMEQTAEYNHEIWMI